MQEAIFKAKAELKRADHLIFVSLKYTRTVDVIKNIIERLISAYEFAFETLLLQAQEQKKIAVVPVLPRLRVEGLMQLFASDEIIQTYLVFYHILRKIQKAKFLRTQEYRRHVTMTAEIDEEKIEITIDIINDYYQKTKEFVAVVDSKINSVVL